MGDAYQTMIFALRNAGHTVEEQDIPGLYRLNGGPEITGNQLNALAVLLLWSGPKVIVDAPA